MKETQEAPVSRRNLGIIRLGIVAKPMCKSLIGAGYRVTVWGHSRSGIEECVGYGAVAGASAREVAERSDVVITMVNATADLRQVVLGPNGVLEGARAGTVLIDMSTVSPKVTKDIAAKLKEKGVMMLDAPVSGSDKEAREGTRSIMVGGPEQAFNDSLPVFKTLGKNVVYMGQENGLGQSMKLCNRVICDLNILAACEGLALAAKTGLDMEKVYSVIKAGAAGSWWFENLGRKVLDRDLESGETVVTEREYLQLVEEVADDLAVSLPGTSLVRQLYNAIEAMGFGECGLQSLIRAYEKLAEVQVKK
jgi:3-hydroxyisobutyrate dehydrogenase-like beta-hydroxyacid dehydrogenase